MPDPAESLRLAVHQFAPVLGDAAANAARIAAAAGGARADLFLTPELGLTGYGIGDAAHSLARAVVPGQPLDLPQLAGTDHVVIGLVERDGALVYNTAAHLHRGQVLHRHRKLYLPTYGMFDEGRFFARGSRVETYDCGAWRIGLLVCEDLWHPALTYLLAAQGAQLLLVQAAAPGRGVWQGSEDGGRFASADVWARIARTFAQLHGVYVALANRVGVEGGVTFAGGSLVAGPDGALLAHAGDEQEETLTVELSLEEVRRARRPYAHARDEDLRLVAGEVARLLGRPFPVY